MKILLTGGTGMVGKNILEHPKAKDYQIFSPTRKEMDLLNFEQVSSVIEQTKPDIIIHTAGLVGGIQANRSALFDFLAENITMGLNVVRAARLHEVPQLINLGSTCMYPKEAPQPLKEEYLFTGPLEPTNEGYAIAKNAVQRACQYASSKEKGISYKTYIPCNLFGRWDHFDPEKSHLLPAIIRKVLVAKEKLKTTSPNEKVNIEIWGTGNPRREFMDAADLADFIFYSLEKFNEVPDVINVSIGKDLSIAELYRKTVEILLGEDAKRIKFVYWSTKPDGMFQKLSDITKQTNLGWTPKTSFQETVKKSYEYFTESSKEGKDVKMPPVEPKRKIALITGVSGQDGSYLSELLLNKGYLVIGMFRRNSKQNHPWMQNILNHQNFIPVYGNMQDSSSLWKILEEYRPDEIYNLAAQSHVRVSFDCPEETFDVVAMGTLRLLNAARMLVPKAKIYQAGSSEQFGFNPEHPQNEKTAFMPASPYACSKVAAHNICVNYREAYKMFISIGILNNHESERRGENFVTRKITKAVANIKVGNQSRLLLGNLQAKRDWGYAKEYCEMIWRMLQHDKPDDFVIATGESHTVGEFVEAVFEEAGLDWKKYVEFDPTQVRPHEVNHLEGDASKAKNILGWEAKVKFKELAKIMYRHDFLEALKQTSNEDRLRKLLEDIKLEKEDSK
jgi:GDPmannose 4,6-dehydratase